MGQTFSVAAFVEPRIVVIFFSISITSGTFGNKQCRSLFTAVEMLKYSGNSTQILVDPAEAKRVNVISYELLHFTTT
ncbi:hypothetical protein EUGRSUZ_E00822 [Eucalyptus grandis]|uniref:Uncharacterized protein n=2 Tax=Eucalyptus grandis TaxID=71139 RepID=A0ACC3KT96_EUCGR|nr:hypothetical protein EUGRSUZ_E00822 [Eucalyptus grandis]